MRAGHPNVRERSRPAGKHAGVGGLDVRVRPEHRCDPPVEPRSERDLLARRLGMDVDHNDGRRCRGLLDEVVDDLPHAVRRLEEERAERLTTATGVPLRAVDHGQPAPRRIRLEVGRPDNGGRRRQIGPDLVASPRVIAERHRVRARSEEPFGESWRDPDPVRDVLAVDDADVDVEALPQARDELLEGVPTRASDDVADEENAHRSQTDD